MGKTGEPFCHEHSGTMLIARAAKGATARIVLLACATVGMLLTLLVLPSAPAFGWMPLSRGMSAAAAVTAAKSTCGLTIDISHPAAGVAISASGVASVQTFSVYLEPRLLGLLKSDATGHLAGRLDLPADARGPQTLRVGSADCAITITFDADAGPPNGPPPPPPPAQQPISAPPPVQVGLSNDLRYGLIALVVTTAVLMLLLTSRLGRRTSSHN